MGFFTAISQGFKQSFEWQGRSSRSEYWYFFLFVIVAYIALIAVAVSIGVTQLIVLYVTVLPAQIGVSVRRLHDTGRSGWWLWLGLIPTLGAIVLIVFYCLRGEAGINRYGLTPGMAPSQEELREPQVW
ncbi:DUF805 domain-containing protein [Amycolatopsis sp. H20-H5]|uniref:DUF805 domain-containing protein n=1 Tax=Amycolatopsis sp. H20-H5 TaxID=3046309 RepID=UPI002DBFA7D7|nr:DUF805 domain-containing protein [Amycolatopsis sp. H20-H5]MEC3979580.1 DUF805 domain-containing protein [Amycolatopsis sp. H20-H5]